MSKILMFMYRDFLEFKNKPIKLLPALISIVFPILSLCLDHGMIADKKSLMILMILVVPIYISMETTLSQTFTYIRDGIFEQYFLNKGIRKYHIVISKWWVNSILSFVSVVFSFAISILLNKNWNIDSTIVINIMLVSYISSVVGIIAATLIKNEKAYFIYVMCMISILMVIFIIFDQCGFFSEVALLVYLIIIAGIGTLLSELMYKSNRFINRDK